MGSNLRVILVAFLLVGFSGPGAFASIPNREIKLDLHKIPEVHPISHAIVNQQFMHDYFPENLPPTTDQKLLAEKIELGVGQKAADKFFNGEFFKKTPAGKVVSEVQQATTQSIVISQGPAKTPQKIDFSLKAIERRAEIIYEGWVSSNLTYTMDDNLIKTMVTKPLSEATSISIANSSPVGEIRREGNLVITHNF